jgi:magnesium chelatase family protein
MPSFSLPGVRQHWLFLLLLPSSCYPPREFPAFPQFPLVKTNGTELPSKRQLAPAELPKQASSFDLPISLGILSVSNQLDSNRFGQYAAVGELSLEGHMRSVKGILSMAMAAAKQPGIKGMIVPAVNAQEAAVVESLEIIPVHTLQEAVGFLNGQLDIDPVPSRLDELFATFSQYDIDFSDVRGQDMAKRALTIAAAGSHNLLMLGPPGSGETEYMTRTISHDTATLA